LAAHAQSRDSARHPGDRLSTRQNGREVVDQQARKLTQPFVLALRHLGTARTSAYFSLAPFIGAVLAIGLLHEAVSVNLALAGLLMGVGLWMHLAERHEHEHPHEALEHEHSHRHDAHHRHPHDGPVSEPHSHWHRHAPLRHSHPHYPDLHHRHGHG
jgi:ABC-type nickel/cobalt efflux system permease component RcnA